MWPRCNFQFSDGCDELVSFSSFFGFNVKATKLRGNLQLSFSNNTNQCDDKYIFAWSFKVDPSYSSKSRRIFFTGRTSEKFSCLFLFLFSFFVFLPKFLVLGPIRPVPIVPGNFWLFKQLSEVLVTSSNFLPF